MERPTFNQIPEGSSVNGGLLVIFAAMCAQPTLPDTTWIRRCFDLAKRGLGRVSPNPPVGAVLVYEGRLLSEGSHAFFGGSHAEVEAITNVAPHDRHLIPMSTLYVSLEPCCIKGKTPACTDLILREGIMDVRISTRDPNPKVAGKGMAILKSNGISVNEGILEHEGKHLIRSFTTNMRAARPHVILKWAQSKHLYIGISGEQIWLSHPDTKVWSHGLRAEADAILVGARTIMTDNPSLTTRDFPGQSPHRVIYDPGGRLTNDFLVFKNTGVQVLYFTSKINRGLKGSHIHQFAFDSGKDHVQKMLTKLFDQNIGMLLVEGGAFIHKLFISKLLWDEAWVIRTQHPLDHGIMAPNLKGRLIDKFELGTDTIIGMSNFHQPDMA